MIEVLIIFAAGAAGFLVFDAYSLYTRTAKDGQYIRFGDLTARSAHIFIYLCAGLVGIFANTDVAVTLGATDSSSFALLFGASTRAFAIGLLGPAGLSRARGVLDQEPTGPDANTSSTKTEAVRVEDMEVRAGSFLEYAKYYALGRRL